MNKLERQGRYLSLYRQKLMRELDAMGYGKSRNTAPNLEADRNERPAPSPTNLVIALGGMRLLDA